MNAPQRFVCVHGHFYQPPRENAWLEAIEVQDSAAPYHDWNARINHECYAANGSSRILNTQNKIIRIVNNYSRISFNFGPTLLAWMEKFAPLTYQKIIDADRISMERFGGHGSAIAQVYNHIILPLASTQDKITQIRWGIADFEHRFGRKPEGMWLSETAVDLESLDLLARHGIRFTILAPHQCARVRAIAKRKDSRTRAWHETPDATVDPTRPYRVHTSDGHSIAVFFYDGPISRAIAFEGLLNDGGDMTKRLLNGFRNNGERGQLVHIATDGESYGHHHRHGDMALAYALQLIEQDSEVHLTNYGEFLEKFPPTSEAEIRENSSWSCGHGVDRWRADCGCNSGQHPDWNQKWRAPLRAALDWLRDATAPLRQQMATTLFHDPAIARDDYIRVILNRTPASQQLFLEDHCLRALSSPERITALKLMEMERHLQLMYNSCGWFFDDLAGIETVQVISYAARVLQLAAEVFGSPGAALEPAFLERLAQAESNGPEHANGAEIYRKSVLAQEIDLERVGAHYAIISMFEPQPETTPLFCYDVRRTSGELLSMGRRRFAYGQAEVSSQITLEREDVLFAVYYRGDQSLSATVQPLDAANQGKFQNFVKKMQETLLSADIAEEILVFDREFDTTRYSLTSLFRDEQRRILQQLLDTTLAEMEGTMRTLYDDHISLLHYLSLSGMPKPRVLMLAAEFSLNADLRQELANDPFDAARLRGLLTQIRADQVEIDPVSVPFVAGQRMLRAMQELELRLDRKHLDTALQICDVLHELPIQVDVWEAQNRWYTISRQRTFADTNGVEWEQKFRELGTKLDIDVDQLAVDNGSVPH
jgi:alpha-amylase/alpha-mannosidase (GH57 family)